MPRLAEFPFAHPVLHQPGIWHPTAPREDYGVLYFRRRVEVDRVGQASLLWSAGMRAELFLDGKLLARGPSRSDPGRWGVVTTELGRLTAGTHVLAFRVVHYGRHAGCGQMGGLGFLLVQGQPGRSDRGRGRADDPAGAGEDLGLPASGWTAQGRGRDPGPGHDR